MRLTCYIRFKGQRTSLRIRRYVPQSKVGQPYADQLPRSRECDHLVTSKTLDGGIIY